MEKLAEKDIAPDNAPKITGMLIDFTVFQLSDILEMLENQAEFDERVEEALTLI